MNRAKGNQLDVSNAKIGSSVSAGRPRSALGWVAAGILTVGGASPAAAKTLIDYFQPMPIVGKLSKTVWGVKDVGARDPKNGIEDSTCKTWSYWDGKIIKAADGKFHLFCSRWSESAGHSGWSKSLAVHAVSDSIEGPYADKGLVWPTNQSGKGHNVTGLTLADGSYMVLCAGTRPGDIFTSKSLDGPWNFLGSMTWDGGTAIAGGTNNTSIIQKPDGSFIGIGRYGEIIASKNLIGPYKAQNVTAKYSLAKANEVYAYVSGGKSEDPVMWYSGGYYHVTYNYWNIRKAYHLMSKDGITNWRNMGIAYDPTTNFLRYTDGTINHWFKIERPGVYIENGHITHWTMAVIDVDKPGITGGSGHNSKVIVVPFDGVAFDADMAFQFCTLDGGTSCGSVGINDAPKASGKKPAIALHGSIYTIDFSGHAAGDIVEASMYSTVGKLVAHQRSELKNGETSVAWEQLNSLPKGVMYFTQIKVGNSVVEKGNFIRL